MQGSLSVVIIALTVGSSLGSRGGHENTVLANSIQASTSTEYENFRRKYGGAAIHHADSTVDYNTRRSLFEARKAAVEAHNANPAKSWVAGLNHLTDYTDQELHGLMGYKRMGHQSRAPAVASSFLEAKPQRAVAESFDWREQLNHSKHFVRDQGACGSCWAVASVGALEMHAEIEMREEPARLSFEQLVDCVPNLKHCGGTGGCAGATAELAYTYVMKNKLTVADDYKGYMSGGDGKCRQEPAGTYATAQDFERLPENNLQALLQTLATSGPIVVSVDASSWTSYESGVFDSCVPDATVNHAVVLIGYGHDTTLQKKYWLIRNSWSPGWGENGHIRLQRHDSDVGAEGFCGVDHDPKKGVGCDGGPKELPVCGMCGVLSDSCYPRGVRITHKTLA